jgi:hypothetical protein
MINDLIAVLMAIPPMLAGGWGAWFLVGLMLSIWGRREKARLVVDDQWSDHGHSSRHKADPVPASERPERPARPAKNVPHSSGDAFGELAALLEPQEGLHRMPGESPVTPNQEAPALAAPRSLP